MRKKTISTLLIAVMVLPAIALASLPQPGDKDYPPYYMLITTNLPHILDMLKKPEVFKLSETQRQRLEEIKKETLDFVMKRMKIIVRQWSCSAIMRLNLRWHCGYQKRRCP